MFLWDDNRCVSLQNSKVKIKERGEGVKEHTDIIFCIWINVASRTIAFLPRNVFFENAFIFIFSRNLEGIKYFIVLEAFIHHEAEK